MKYLPVFNETIDSEPIEVNRRINVIFSSNIFLFLFFPCVLLIYFLLHRPYRNMFLLLSSLAFYAWGEPKFVFVMVGSIVINYSAAIAVEKNCGRQGIRKLLLIATVVANLSLLIYYKYLDFFIETVNCFGFAIPMRGIVLPIGISFFTFQAMSYVIDVYRGDAAVQKKVHNVALYIAFFPQLIAGPIVRYQTIANQIEERTHSFSMFSNGTKRFVCGFAKKIILANNMAIIADKAFGLPASERSILYAWLGVIAYSLQIYFDFSGYSDMAVGLGKMFGFTFLENFNYPYISKSVSEFWRRWHISLGQWFRDYLYFPLGGSRVRRKSRLVVNLLIVWVLTGFWHGASWNTVLWGLLYFVLISFEKLSGYPDKFHSCAASVLYRIFTLLCVVSGMVLVRTSSVAQALQYYAGMLGMQGNRFYCEHVYAALRDYWFFVLSSIICSTELFRYISGVVNAKKSRAVSAAISFISVAGYIFLLVWSFSYIILGSHNPFIYFNF